MAYSTAEVEVQPSDGWVEVANNPAFLMIKPHSRAQAWFFAISAAAPAATVRGLPMGRQDSGGQNIVQIHPPAAITGKAFVRVERNADAISKVKFTVIKDVA